MLWLLCFRSAPSMFQQKTSHLYRAIWESLVFRLHSEIGQSHLSIEAHCDHHIFNPRVLRCNKHIAKPVSWTYDRIWKGKYWIWYGICPSWMWDMYHNVGYWFYTASMYQTVCTMHTQGVTLKVPPGDMAVQCPCFLVWNSNGWADFVSNLVLPFLFLVDGLSPVCHALVE